MNYYDDVDTIKGIGDKTKNLLAKLNIISVKDLLEHYPRNYDEFKNTINISEIREGDLVAVEGTLATNPVIRKIRKLQIINTSVQDPTGKLSLTWFNMPFLLRSLRPAYRYVFRGKISKRNGVLSMEQPKIYEWIDYHNMLNKLQPIYSLTAGLTNNSIKKFVNIAINETDEIIDYLPKKILKQMKLISKEKAIKTVHFPKYKDDILKARERLVFDEFFLYLLAIRRLKDKTEKLNNQYIIKNYISSDKLIENLSYSLTNAQVKVWDEIKKELSGGNVMNRLIQGDVGSGKTIIAALALLEVAISGFQGSIMAPTEILAKQHYESLISLFNGFDLSICLLVGSMTAKEKREAYKKIKDHEVDIIVGTHALIQDKVEYKDLALVITDEQHRFGVNQRKSLSEKGTNPHTLVMSATPIPRTLAIILYGDLDISIIDELPTNRLPIKNAVVNSNYRSAAYKLIIDQVKLGRQAYVICPMVEESETIEAENVIQYTEILKESLPETINIEYIHGKMKANDKNNVMNRFAKGEIDVLVSTTVVEVGMNVPNATIMMVENAERFGLAQLHQLRGRVGRGEYQSYCMFFCGTESKVAKERLEILRQSNDGFYIASEDLKLRGPGDMFGIIQSGELEFKIADIYNDSIILKKASELAKELTDKEVDDIILKTELDLREVSL
ncbi:MAG TPA: ATP-dependent DNA helicase RecG [Clostridiales bacterium]|nr:ATP-dependent DNA helicase RecG [Clostridiales bacterium]